MQAAKLDTACMPHNGEDDGGDPALTLGKGFWLFTFMCTSLCGACDALQVCVQLSKLQFVLRTLQVL